MIKHKLLALAAIALSAMGLIAAPPRQASGKVDVSGTWLFEVETSAGSGSPTFTFQQQEERLSGQYKGTFGEAEVKGTVKGQEIKFSFVVNAQGTDVVMSYEGVIEGGGMKGKMAAGDVASGTWTAKKQQAGK